MKEQSKNPSDKIWNDTDLIGLTVTLKSKTGRSFQDKGIRITRKNLEYFVPPFQHVRDAKKELKKAGFRIVAESRLGFSIVGEKKLIEEYFDTKISVKTTELKHAKKVIKIRMPDAELTVPKELLNIIDRVKFEQYPIPLESEIPPNPDYFHLNVPDDIIDILHADTPHSCGVDGTGIKLCMLDDGFFQHAYYSSMEYNITTISVIDGEDIPEGKGHGTAIATNALAIAPNVEFLVINSTILGIFSVATAAFRKAKEENPDIITCSWGLSSINEDLEWEINDAINNGIVVIFACGNGGTIYFPGCMDDVISVGGVYPEEDGGFHAATYASSGECADNPGRQCPDICGLVGDEPAGVLIMMPTVPDGNYDNTFENDDETDPDDGWIVASGTSSAAPQVAGVVALMLQCNPLLTPEEVKSIIQETATDITVGNSASGEAAGPGIDLATGHGLVHTQRAVERAGCSCGDSTCRITNQVSLCHVSSEVYLCHYVLEAGIPCRYIIEAGVPCSWRVETCRLESMVGPGGGCGPISLIAADFDRWREYPSDRFSQYNPIIKQRLTRMVSISSLKKHIRTLSARIIKDTNRPIH